MSHARRKAKQMLRKTEGSRKKNTNAPKDEAPKVESPKKDAPKDQATALKTLANG